MKAALFVLAGLAVPASAANIYLLSSTDSATDAAAVAALTSRGHTVTVGVDYTLFDGTVNLAGFQTVYLQSNFNWVAGSMPAAGQQQLINWVNAGGRLVTSEWVVYYTYVGGKFEMLGPTLPAASSINYGTSLSATYSSVTPNAVINAGLPSSFAFPLTSYAGTETFTAAQPGATTYYSTSNSPTGAGLVGWAVGAGSAFCFTSTCGPDQVADANFGRLFSNVMNAVGVAACYPNCDGSTTAPILNVLDFTCFLNSFAAGSTYANCDHSTTTPVLNVLDFTCFLNSFAAGCH